MAKKNLMYILSLEILKMVRKMEKVKLYIKIKAYMKEILLMTKLQELELIYG